MAKKYNAALWTKAGVWSYVAGIALALVVSIFSDGALSNWATGTLIILGLIVGLVNIADKEALLFLVGAIAFIIAAGEMEAVFSYMGVAFAPLQTFMRAIIVFTAPGVLVVSFKALYEAAKDV